MIEAGSNEAGDTSPGDRLRERLVRDARAARSAPSVLRHMLANRSSRFFDEATIVHLVAALDDGRGELPGRELTPYLAAITEWRTAELLTGRGIVDNVSSPLLSALAVSEECEARSAARNAMDAQSRFDLTMRRMDPLGEPDRLREQSLDELLKVQLVDDVAPVSLRHCGVAVFVSWLAARLEMARDDVVLALDPGQATRFATLLRAAGLTGEQASAEVLLLHPHVDLPMDILDIDVDAARSLLHEGDRT